MEAKPFLQPGDPCPNFKAPAALWSTDDEDAKEIEVKLDDFKGKFLILMFYPQDFTYVCPTEVLSLARKFEDFQQIDCNILACSTDSVACHRAWMKLPGKLGGIGPIPFPLVSDANHNLAKAFKVFKPDEGVAFRGQFVIDDKGIIRQIVMNDFPVGRDSEETFKFVQAYQHFDEFSEVCPANWKPGKKTFKPTFDNASKYIIEELNNDKNKES